MGKFDSITVVSVAGEGDGTNAVYAIERSMAELPGSQGLLLATARPNNLGCKIAFESIKHLDYYQYNLYSVLCLYYHIRTDYVLVVQPDGWVLNGLNWKDEWLSYDYIGAPCPIGGHAGKVLHGFEWATISEAIPVLCGGFSLRSRALLEAPTKYGICYKSSEVPYLRHDDVQICLSLRSDLEACGMKIAPLAVALEFCVEYLHPAVHKDLDLHRVFGHHGKTRQLRGHSVVETNITQSEIDRIYGENRMISLLEEYGYTVRRKW